MGGRAIDCTKRLMQKLWVDPEGNVIPVPDSHSHEEYANSIGHELEDLLAQGWCRIQNVPPPYLLIDVHLPLTAPQAEAIRRLFENRFSVYVVEFRGVVREFGDGVVAMAWVLGRP